MRLFLCCDELSVDISDKDQRYGPDVLEDWCNRATEMLAVERLVALGIEDE